MLLSVRLTSSEAFPSCCVCPWRAAVVAAVYYASGTSIARFPSEGVIVTRSLKDQGREVVEGVTVVVPNVAVLGLYQMRAGSHAGGAGPPAGGAGPLVGGAGPPAGGAGLPAGGAGPPVGGAGLPVGGAKPHAGGAEPHAGGAESHAAGAEPHVGGAEPRVEGTEPHVGGAEPAREVKMSEPQAAAKIFKMDTAEKKRDGTRLLQQVGEGLDVEAGLGEEPAERQEKEAGHGERGKRERRKLVRKAGRVALYGDSNCLDSSHLEKGEQAGAREGGGMGKREGERWGGWQIGRWGLEGEGGG